MEGVGKQRTSKSHRCRVQSIGSVSRIECSSFGKRRLFIVWKRGQADQWPHWADDLSRPHVGPFRRWKTSARATPNSTPLDSLVFGVAAAHRHAGFTDLPPDTRWAEISLARFFVVGRLDLESRTFLGWTSEIKKGLVCMNPVLPEKSSALMSVTAQQLPLCSLFLPVLSGSFSFFLISTGLQIAIFIYRGKCDLCCGFSMNSSITAGELFELFVMTWHISVFQPFCSHETDMEFLL